MYVLYICVCISNSVLFLKVHRFCKSLQGSKVRISKWAEMEIYVAFLQPEVAAEEATYESTRSVQLTFPAKPQRRSRFHLPNRYLPTSEDSPTFQASYIRLQKRGMLLTEADDGQRGRVTRANSADQTSSRVDV